MEDLLRRALSPYLEIREPAEAELRSLETNQNLLLPLFSLFETTEDFQLKLFCLILAKSVISRQWHITLNNGQISSIPEDQKSFIKNFLISKLFIQPASRPSVPHLISCLEGVSKVDFYENWPELINYFYIKIQNLTEVDLKVLKVLVKCQIKRRTKFRQFRDWILSIYPSLRPLWSQVNSEDFDKIIMKCLTVKNDPEMISELLARCGELLSIPNGEVRLRVVLKGLNLIENIFPKLFTSNILQEFLKVNYKIITEIDLKQDKYFALVRQVVYNIRQIIETNDEAATLMQPYSLTILQKTSESLSFESYWELWNNGEYLEVLCRKKEENAIKKLLISLMTLYPEVKAQVYSILPNLNVLEFKPLFTSLSLISLLRKVNRNTSSEDFRPELILNQISKNSLISGFERKIIWKKASSLVRKHFCFVRNFEGVFEWVLFLKKAAKEDLVLVYDCCLTAKEMMNYNIGQEFKERIIDEFEDLRVEILDRIEKC